MDETTRKGRRASCALALAILCTACTGEAAPPAKSEVHASEAGNRKLEGRFGSPDALWGIASYKVSREAGGIVKELEVEIENAKPGVRHTVTVDGKEVGRMITNLDGEGELELVDDGVQSFPDGFVEPGVGSVVRVGDLMELRLDTLEVLTYLAAYPSGAVSGKIGYKVERLGDVVTQKFQIKLEGAPPSSAHAVRLAGVAIGDLLIDEDGEGKLEFSTKEGLAFPDGFPDLAAGSEVVVGDLYVGRLDAGQAGAK